MCRVFVSINGHPLDKTDRDANLFCWFRHLERVSFFVPAESWDMFKRIAIITSSILLVVAVVSIGFAYFSLSNKQGQINERAISLQNELLSSGDDYAKCYNSINRGSFTINDVSLSYLRYDSTDAEKDKLNSISSDFMDGIKKQCETKVSDYEDNYQKLSDTIKESNQTAWVSFLIGGNQVTDRDLSGLSPTYVRFNAGDPLTYMIFTKQDVEQYFSDRI